MDARVIRLEERLMFLERHVEELDGVVREMHRRLDVVRDEMDHLDQLVRRPMALGDDDETADAPAE